MSSTKNVSTPFLLERRASKNMHCQKASFHILIHQYSAAITHILSMRKPIKQRNRKRPHYINPITTIIIIIMYIYHALINALSTHMVPINLNMIFYTYVEPSPTKTIYLKYYTEKHTHTDTHTMILAGMRIL